MKGSESSISRRSLFRAAVTAGAASMLASESARGEEPPAESEEADVPEGAAPGLRIVDTNIHLFQWPFRRLPLDEVDALVRKLRDLGIVQAWAASFDGILHRDVSAVNRRLVEACRQHSELVPVGAVNPTLPDWQEDLRQCVEEHGVSAVRLYPNYHGYGLDDPRFARLLAMASESQRLVQVAAALEDTRTQHPSLRAEDVDLTPLPALMRDLPDARVQVLNARPRPSLLKPLAENPQISFDTARTEGTDGVAELLRMVSPDRVMFGSHAPFLIPEAALIRVHESGLEEAELRLLLADNAHRVLSKCDG